PLAAVRLGYAGLPVPRNLVTADDVKDGKPSPEPYLKGAALLHASLADCLVFEDTPAGIASARAAGMRVIALGNTYPAHELRAADGLATSLAQAEVKVHETTIVVSLAAVSMQKI